VAIATRAVDLFAVTDRIDGPPSDRL